MTCLCCKLPRREVFLPPRDLELAASVLHRLGRHAHGGMKQPETTGTTGGAGARRMKTIEKWTVGQVKCKRYLDTPYALDSTTSYSQIRISFDISTEDQKELV